MTVKKVSGKYYIEEFDEALPATYYIIEKGIDSNGGVFDGSIKQLVWVGDSLFANVQRLSSADTNGWYKLDLQSGFVSGPLAGKRIPLSKSVSSKDFFQSPAKYRYSATTSTRTNTKSTAINLSSIKMRCFIAQ